jgi:two-component sensor histidine kinase
LICINVIWLPPSFLFATGVQVTIPDTGKADDMTVEHSLHTLPLREALPLPASKFQKPANCPLVSCSAISAYERELEKHRDTEAKLRRSVIREAALRRQKDKLIQQKDVFSKESEHRMLNGLQLISSLLSIQSRATKNAEAAEQLTIAANRVAAIGRVHRHLHALDRVESVEFKQYLECLCCDLSGMASDEGPERVLVIVEGIELSIPTGTGIPLGFIASELITNAIKYAKGKLTVSLQTTGESGCALSVSDDGPGLPKGFNPTATGGLGMKLISALVRQIGGQLQIAQGDNGKGARFTVLFSCFHTNRGADRAEAQMPATQDPGTGVGQPRISA